MLLNEGVVREWNSPLAYPGLTSLQDELTNRLQVGKTFRNDKVFQPQMKLNPETKPTVAVTHPQATYGSSIFIMAIEVLLILRKAPLKILRSLII